MNAAVRVEREKRRAAAEARAWEREKLIWDRVLTPNVVRLALVSGILAYSTWATRSKENVGPVQSVLATTLPVIGIPMLAADAGIRDKYALAAIATVAAGYVAGSTVKGWSDVGMIPGGSDILEQLSRLAMGPAGPVVEMFT